MLEAIGFVFATFVMFFVIIDPLGCVPIFAAITRKKSKKERRLIAIKAPSIAFFILVFFAFWGKSFLSILGISMPAFSIAGGILLLIVAIKMLFTGFQTESASGQDVSAFPLAIPLLAGPGSITALILLWTAQSGNYLYQFLVIAVLFFVLLVCAILFEMVDALSKYLTTTVNNIITGTLGIVLGALAIQYVINGFLTVQSL